MQTAPASNTRSDNPQRPQAPRTTRRQHRPGRHEVIRPESHDEGPARLRRAFFSAILARDQSVRAEPAADAVFARDLPSSFEIICSRLPDDNQRRTGSHHEAAPPRALRLFRASRGGRTTTGRAASGLPSISASISSTSPSAPAWAIRYVDGPAAQTRAPLPGATTATASAYGGCSTCSTSLAFRPATSSTRPSSTMRRRFSDRINARKDEIIGHGRTNAERQGQMWEEDEARLIAYVRDAHHRSTADSRRAAGWGRGCRRAA